MNTKEVQLGNEPFIHDHVMLKNVEFGKYNEVGTYNFFENVIFGDYSYTGQFCFIQNAVIGKFSNIAAMVRIGPTDHPYERPSLHHFTYRKKMFGFSEQDDHDFFEHRVSRKAFIGHDTWIGHGAIIQPDVTIGNGAIIGSGAIVTKDIPPYAIAVGVPAKVIKYRFPPEVIEGLQAIQWWDWPYEKIKEHLDDFHLDIEQFIKKHNGRKE
ncbi:acetyltransferase [Siminovitchia terrae]|uniref:Acetyltransferase n=1 Tax=Siminovitchia terrae TaxID=1914933 RepID=A0A429XE20_SIMTE|nr:chloramphenicol acetyltransferase [Siminovitchia terrae]RST61705.1 chloramphenicol acetyltransferase [Siminovitchia terrae]GIN97130.1 acetyltransferase [Siminovitchia terrae]